MAPDRRILVVDDEPDIIELVTYNLRKEGFEVIPARDGEEGMAQIRRGRFDLVILDLMLPGMPGLDICRFIRSKPDTHALPVIMLTARSEETDRVVGLETGADDYMTKPFSPRELIARVRAVLRRSELRESVATVRLGDLEVNPEAYTVSKRGDPVSLSATEFRLLLYLAQRQGRVFSRDQLLDAVWKDEAYVEPRTVDVHIRRLRAQIEDDPSRPRYVKTRRGIGYYAEGGQ